MKKLFPFFIFIFILSGCVTYAPVQSPTPSKSKSDAKVEGVVAEPVYRLCKIRSIAVLYETPSDLNRVMADHITRELMNLGYQVVERKEVDKVISEHKFQISGLVNQEKSGQLGKMIGADAVVLGTTKTKKMRKPLPSNNPVDLLSYSLSYFDTELVISNATMKVVCVEQANIIMTITLTDEGEGRKADEAAHDLVSKWAELNNKFNE